MEHAALGVLLIVTVILVGLVVWLHRQRQALRGRSRGSTALVRTAREAAAEPLDALDLSKDFEAGAIDHVAYGDLLVYPTDDPGEMLVFGDETTVRLYGSVIGRLPASLAQAAVGTDALMKAGMEAGQQAGMLVRLTPKSTQKFRDLQKIKDSSGAALGVLRGTDGKIAHVIRFKPASLIQSASGVSGALGAIAMQAQLASIERAIGEAIAKIDTVQQTIDRGRNASGIATREVILEVYRTAQATGTLTRAMWDQIAPLNRDVRQLQKYAELEVTDLVNELTKLSRRPIKDRREKLGKIKRGALQSVFDNLQRDNRALVQYQALRLWHLTAACDPGLNAYVGELRLEMKRQPSQLKELHQSVQDAVRAVVVSKRLQVFASPFDARKVEQRRTPASRRVEGSDVAPRTAHSIP